MGSEEPSADYNIWVDPNGTSTDELATKKDLENKQDKLTAGTNITIDSNNVISASQPIKTSELTNDSGFITNEYHDATKQDKLVAGTNITIDSNNVISATGSGGGGSSYTFTDGLTETDGTVKWDLNDRIKSGGTGIDYIYSTVIGKKGTKTAYQNGLAGGGYDGIKAGNASLAFGTTREINSYGFNYNGSGIIAGNIFGNSVATYQGGNIAFGFAESAGLIKSSGVGSFAVGFSNALTMDQGIQSTSTGSIAMGACYNGGKIKSSGVGSIAVGYSSGVSYSIEVTGQGAFAVGEASSDSQSLKATGASSFAQGRGVQATGFGSVAHGYKSTASGNYATANGLVTKASSPNQFVTGKRNVEDSSEQYSFIVGNGTSDTERSNAYTLDWQGNGTFAGTVSSSTGADYAEYFEWKDGNPNNEDRVGYIVTLDGDKIVKANTGDDVLGICSGTALVLGDSAEWNWSKRYLTDDFGRIIYEDYDVEHEEIKDDDGNIIREAWTEHIHAPKQNPDYDTTKPYIKRADRPEWQIVGMMGKLYVRDDGSCVVNGYADVVNGIATKATGKTNMRVMERINDSIIRVLMK